MKKNFVPSLVLIAFALAGSASCGKNPTSYGGGAGSGGGGGSSTATFNFGPFAAGQSVTRQFTASGSTGYHCTPHRSSGMVGTVNVAATGDDSAVVQVGAGNSLTFSPATVNIKTNATVRWVNVSNSTMHTVTSN